jgi:uncharacterized membrane protein YccC
VIVRSFEVSPMSLSLHFRIVREAVRALGRELAAWRPTRERGAFGAEAVLSVVLAVTLAHAFELENTWWAAISGYAVMQATLGSSLQRGADRILGTLVGAAVAIVVGTLIGNRPWLFVPAMAVIGGVSVYCGNGSSAPYAWTLGGLTAVMVMYQSHALESYRATAVFGGMRAAEVIVGTVSCIIVAAAFHYAAKWYRLTRPAPSIDALHEDPAAIAEPPAPPHALGMSATPAPAAGDASADGALRPDRRLLCLQGALAVAVLALLAYYLDVPGFLQALVTSVIVLILPAAIPPGHSEHVVAERMWHRLAGCLFAGIIAIALLPVMKGDALLCMLALSLGIWVGCHVQTGKEGASYIGRQFTITFIMVFVQDHQWSADVPQASMRLAGIFEGILVLAAVMAATNWIRFAPAQPKGNPQSDRVDPGGAGSS